MEEVADPAKKLVALGGAMTVQGKAAGAGALVAEASLVVFYPNAKSDGDMHFEGKAISSDWNIDEFVSAKALTMNVSGTLNANAVGLGESFLPRHHPLLRPSFLELNGII